ncbi:mediator of RNA polymerase II transcription subunit 15-like [Orussus abietinus]|uniref:mediator of RNA polymerase II transcription subunit 15-like n=1 Tax=Orussus abietinus TaxID=222816 RepID=UPI0006261E70|nr:mediator of RNA polymerase II transcription subunit 15-like [Orussus abietinus]
MKLRVLIFALVSTCLAQDDQERAPRAPQGYIKYSDPNGLKVDWKLYTPYSQWQAQLDDTQRTQRAEAPAPEPAQAAQPRYQHQQASVQSPLAQQKQAGEAPAKPYKAIPMQIKQLILQAYEPEETYANPQAFFYQPRTEYDQQPAQQQKSVQDPYQAQAPYQAPVSQTPYQAHDSDETAEYKARSAGQIDEKEVKEDRSEKPYVSLSESMPVQPAPQLQLDKNMPTGLQQLLQYQAQLPYNVIANHIVYRPKDLFIPKPIVAEEKKSNKYNSKVYVLKSGQDQNEEASSKPDQENRG